MRFRLRPGYSWGDVVTAVVVRESDGWTLSSWIDARLEAGGDFETLDELVRAADLLVQDSYPQGSRRATAELQYAIYPWTFKGREETILDVTGEAGAFVASDISGARLEVHGGTVEELVAAASSALGAQPRAMLRWVKKVSELASW